MKSLKNVFICAIIVSFLVISHVYIGSNIIESDNVPPGEWIDIWLLETLLHN